MLRGKDIRDNFNNVARIVVKVGSSTLTHETGRLNLAEMEKLVRQLADLHNQGKEVVLVTSGAVGAGMGKLGLNCKPRTIPEKQACAAVGQGILMHMYEKLFAEYGGVVAQVLLTREDVTDRQRFLNARNALLSLMQMRVIPIINENDTVAVEEIRFGDNDNLSALVASLIEADLLILMTDIDGLYTANPREDKDATIIHDVREITPQIKSIAGGAGSLVGTGGMLTKIQAGKIAVESGVAMVIADGSQNNIIRHILAGEKVGTLFHPKENPLHAKKQWIAFGSAVRGKIFIDQGAKKALVSDGKSLLPGGITGYEGRFKTGNTVSIIDDSGVEIARGVVNYSHKDVDKIKGHKSNEIEEILGFKDYDEVIHRNNMVLCI